MVRLSKIYTKSGDDGSTGLGDGSRVAKTSPRVGAYGSADELGAVIGMAASQIDNQEWLEALRRVQNDLFDLGADLCVPESETPPEYPPLRVREEQVLRLEREIDSMNEELPALNSFVLSGGRPAGAALHLARTVARRCEREVLGLTMSETINPWVQRYLNRLSDYLFVFARMVNGPDGEILWKPGGEEAS